MSKREDLLINEYLKEKKIGGTLEPFLNATTLGCLSPRVDRSPDHEYLVVNLEFEI